MEHMKIKETLKMTKKIGDQWAEIARRRVFASLTKANLEKTMVRSIWLLDDEIIFCADYITDLQQRLRSFSMIMSFAWGIIHWLSS